MATTKEQVIAKATELGLTLTAEEITKFITDDKLPDELFKQEKRYKELEEKAKVDPSVIADIIKQLRDANSEAGDRRKQAKDLKTKLDKIESDKQKEKEDKLKADGEFQKLLDEKEKELNDLKPFKERFETQDKALRESLLKKIPDTYKEYAELLPTDKLLGFVDTVSIPDPLKTHDGNGTPPPAPRTLTSTEKRQAEQLGLDDAAYIEVMADREARKQKV